MRPENKKPIEGFEGLYYITMDGRVFNQNGHEIRPRPVRGYPQVGLWKEGKATFHYVHRLVARAYVPNPRGLDEVNHKDGNKANPSAANLEWVTHHENLIHARDNGLLKTKPISAYDRNGHRVKTFNCLREAATFCGVAYTAGISRALSHAARTAHGYEWRYG